MIRFECPHCGKGLRTDDSTAGAAFTCPSCRGRVRVPQSSDSSERRSRESASAAVRFTVRPYQPPSRFAAVRVARFLIVAVIAGAVAGAIAFVVAQSSALSQPLIWAGAAALAVSILAVIVGLLLPACAVCSRCHRRKSQRVLGTMQRDGLSAKEALEAGDLAALRALSPEGDDVRITVAHCDRCGSASPIDVLFSVESAGGHKAGGCLLAHVTYPGAALPAFERLCQRESVAKG